MKNSIVCTLRKGRERMTNLMQKSLFGTPILVFQFSLYQGELNATFLHIEKRGPKKRLLHIFRPFTLPTDNSSCAINKGPSLAQLYIYSINT